MTLGKKLTIWLASLAVMFGLASTTVIAAEPETPGIIEFFACNYLSGKDQDDLMAARDYYVKQAAKGGVETPPAFLWTLEKGDGPLDFAWLNGYESLLAYASAQDANAASSEMGSVFERFDTIAKCTSNIGLSRTVFAGGEPAVTNPPGYLNAFSCKLRHGNTDQDVLDLEQHANFVWGSIPSYKSYQFVSVTPITGGPDAPDRFYFGINDSASAWAQRIVDVNSSPGGAALDRHINTVLKCDNSLWTGTQIVGGEG